jgi:hypothetical protein
MESPKVGSSVLLAVVSTYQWQYNHWPWEEREWRGEGEREHTRVRGERWRWRHLWYAFSRCRGVSRSSQRMQHPPPLALASAWPWRNGWTECSCQAMFCLHVGCFENNVVLCRKYFSFCPIKRPFISWSDARKDGLREQPIWDHILILRDGLHDCSTYFTILISFSRLNLGFSNFQHLRGMTYWSN